MKIIFNSGKKGDVVVVRGMTATLLAPGYSLVRDEVVKKYGSELFRALNRDVILDEMKNEKNILKGSNIEINDEEGSGNEAS